MRRVRAETGPGFTVGVRLSPEDFGNARGLDLDESLQVARWLVEDGADFIHVSLWDVHRSSTKRPDQKVLPLFRELLPADVKVLVAGKIWTRAEAEEQLTLGADAVALGRSAILNPDWPLRARTDGWDPKRPPASIDELCERSLSPRFAEYMRRWKGFVAP
jgi:2,4-dienoyl-CoA reductase-like NADH-dependent reductase (Old Yellow Enzyme family)